MSLKRLNRFLIVMLALAVLMVAAGLSVRNSMVQTRLANRILSGLTKLYEGQVSVGKVFIRWPHRIEIDGILILDPLNDTLFYSPELRSTVKKLNLDKNSLSLGRLTIREPLVRIRQLPSGEMNYEKLLDGFKSKDTLSESKPFILQCRQLLIGDGSFGFKKYGSLPAAGKVNPDNLSFNGVGASLMHLVFDGENIKFDIMQFAAAEQSGFRVNELIAGVILDHTGISAQKIELTTGNSRISSGLLSVSGLKGQSPDSAGLRFMGEINPGTRFGPADLSYFSDIHFDPRIPVHLSGIVSGTSHSANLLNARIVWAGLLEFDGDLQFDYRGDLANSYFNLVSRDLIINIEELANRVLSGQIPGVEPGIPGLITDFGTIEYKGRFMGTSRNFISRGNWLVALSSFETDLSVIRDRPQKGYNFKGTVSAVDFNPDEWVNKPTGFSDMELRIGLDGNWDGQRSVNALLDGNITRFTLNDYQFQDLAIRGEASGQHFTGNISLSDPNIAMKMSGQFDFGREDPEYSFRMQIEQADLAALNIDKKDTVSMLNLNLEGILTGRNVDEINGQILVSNSSYRNSRGVLPVKELSVVSLPELGQRKMTLSSEYIDARILGIIHMADLPAQMVALIDRYIPALAAKRQVKAGHLNDFSFNVHLKNPGPVTDILTPGFQCKDNSRISGSFNAGDQTIYMEGNSPQFVLAGSQFTDLNFRIGSEGDSLVVSGDLAKIQFDRNTYFENIEIGSGFSGNRMNASVELKNSGKVKTAGQVSCHGLFSTDSSGALVSDLRFPATRITYKDTVWNIDPFGLSVNTSQLLVDRLRITHDYERIEINGLISDNPADTLYVVVKQMNLNYINEFTQSGDFVLGGSLSGTARLFDLRQKGMFLAELEVDSLMLNGEPLGKTTISSRSGGAGDQIFMDVLARRGNINTFILDGYIDPTADSLNFYLALDKLRMNLLNPFVNPDLKDIKGIATGNLRITGRRSEPELNGNLLMQKASFLVDYLNTRFFFTHNLEVTPEAFWVRNLDMQDEEGNHAYVTGGLRHNRLKDLFFDFALDYQDFILLNTGELRNDGYWGRAYATGTGTIKGPLKNMVFDISAQTARKTRFFVPVTSTGEVREIDFITYVQRPTENQDFDLLDFSEKKRNGYEVNLNGPEVKIDLEVTPDAEVQLIFDSKVGDAIRGEGSGDLRIHVNPSGKLTMTGDYTLEGGDYRLTLQDMPVKKFDIEPGGTIKWTGDVANAQLDIDAVYRTKAALYDLLQDESNSNLTQRIPVEAHLLMTGYLERPAFRFKIVLPPTSYDLARSQLENLTEEDMNKQIISLLILNRFMPLQGFASGTSRGYETAGLTTTTEVLSNQLNYWLSQISNDFDIGFNYRPGDELTSDEVEVALSTQLLNDRMIINVNGNYDVRPTNTNSKQLVGDVEVEYKIKPSGRLRIKAFTRANDHLLYEYAPYTQGVGLFYRQEFNSFRELLHRYWDRLSRKNEEVTK